MSRSRRLCAVFWRAVQTWALPTGYILGLHFVQLGHPYDYQLYSSYSSIAILALITNRQFACADVCDYENTTAAVLVIGGISILAFNVLRFSRDGLDMRPNSLLSKTVQPEVMLRVRQLYFTTGFLFSGHFLYLGYRVPTFISITLVRPLSLALRTRADEVNPTASSHRLFT